ncbi:hypothetical protein CASFOL_027118 [Castilleja foliolosa]|uniref:Uncharacterized protein n=1 Tax=Castilleja foliolosa TaxID=1961234 RepID=A0ABD3CKB5_9LAMI
MSGDFCTQRNLFGGAIVSNFPLRFEGCKQHTPSSRSSGKMALLYNSRAKLFPGKLQSRWSGPYTIREINDFGAVTLHDAKTDSTFQVNGQRVKMYYDGYYLKGKDEKVLVDGIMGDQ